MTQAQTSETAPQNSVIDILALKSLASIAVASTGVAYSPYFALPDNLGALGLVIGFTSSGAIDVKVDLEQGNTVPTDSASDATWMVGDVLSTGLTAAGPHALVVEPVATRYGRLKFTGQGSNAATTVVSRAEIGVSKAS